MKVCEHILTIYGSVFCERLGRRMSRAETIKTFAVSRSTIKRYLKLRRETGDVKLKDIESSSIKERSCSASRTTSQLEAHPDATLTEHCQIWESTHSVQVSSATMSRAIQRFDWTRKKKTLRAREQKEADRAAGPRTGPNS